MKQLKPIYTGYKNAILRNDLIVEQEAKRRLAICNRCPLKATKLNVDYCSNCGCFLAALTRQNQKICSNWKK